MIDKSLTAIFKPITKKTAKKTYSYPTLRLKTPLFLPEDSEVKIIIFPLNSGQKSKPQNK